MEIKDMNNSELCRRYAEILVEIETKHFTKKQMEDEMKYRLREGKFVDGSNV